MKTLLAVMLNLLLFFPQLTFAQDENVCSKGEKCQHLYVATEKPRFLDYQVIEGDNLPVYLGYFTINQSREKLYFTNKSAFELKYINEQIKVLLNAGFISEYPLYVSQAEFEKIPNGEPVWHYWVGRLPLTDFSAGFNLKRVLERWGLCVLGISNNFITDYDALQPTFFIHCVYREDERKPNACRNDDPYFAPILRMVPHYGLDFCFPLYDPLHRYTGYWPK